MSQFGSSPLVKGEGDALLMTHTLKLLTLELGATDEVLLTGFETWEALSIGRLSMGLAPAAAPRLSMDERGGAMGLLSGVGVDCGP